MVEVLIAEMFGSDRSRPKDYERAVVVDGRGAKETRKTTLRSEWRSALKKSLTEPALLEMSGDAFIGHLLGRLHRKLHNTDIQAAESWRCAKFIFQKCNFFDEGAGDIGQS
jgi:hypothetical protein